MERLQSRPGPGATIGTMSSRLKRVGKGIKSRLLGIDRTSSEEVIITQDPDDGANMGGVKL